MTALDYCYCSLIITVVYLLLLLRKRKYRLLLPSVVYSFIWAITSFLMICQITGFLVNKAAGEDIFSQSAQFAFMLIIAAIIGFTIAHIFADTKQHKKVRIVDVRDVDIILKRFIWIPYLCGVIGILLIIYYLSFAGGIDNLGDYRLIALYTKKTGYMAVVQRISGHINFLGTFYLMLLGYRDGQTGLKVGKFLLYFFLCSAINIAIAGRSWILTSSLPFLVTFVFARKYCGNIPLNRPTNDWKKLIAILVILVSLFSLIGIVRNNHSSNDSATFVSKFFYLTDGARMTNLVLKEFPEGSYEEEYGMSSLADGFISSSMKSEFAESISGDIGLSVTVKSYMPPLYYDFGELGGAIFWCILCIFIEYWAICLKYKHSIFSVLLMGQICIMLFLTPVGNPISVYTPAFEWLLIIYILRRTIFLIPHRNNNTL